MLDKPSQDAHLTTDKLRLLFVKSMSTKRFVRDGRTQNTETRAYIDINGKICFFHIYFVFIIIPQFVSFILLA